MGYQYRVQFISFQIDIFQGIQIYFEIAAQKSVLHRKISIRNPDCAEVLVIRVPSDPFDKALIGIHFVDAVFKGKGGFRVVRVKGSISFQGKSRSPPAFKASV